MANHSTELSNARKNKIDEFYTLYSDIEAELSHYDIKDFENKTIYCNCDNPYTSNFTLFFVNNFEKLKLKRLICTCFSNKTKNLFEEIKPVNDKPYYLDITNIKDWKDNIKVLQGDGDFRSQECIDLLKQSDIVITNPPYSLWRIFFKVLVDNNKKFIIWGNNTCMTYKDVWPYFIDNKVWIGYGTKSQCMKFTVPDNYEKYDEKLTKKINDGKKYACQHNIYIYTNLDIPKRHQILELTKTYNNNDYPKYDNYDIIEVKHKGDIPKDYKGIMAVPVTILYDFNAEQFELVDGNKIITKDKKFSVNGKEPFCRILIKFR